MFFKKKKFDGWEFDKCPDPFKDKVKCDECKCWLDETDSYKVESWGIFGKYKKNYCQQHKKPYSEIWSFSGEIKYFGTLQMDEKGNPIKNK